MKILICRTDNIGDLVLSLPLASLLRQHYPDAEIWYLARGYTQAIFTYVDFVDGMLDWDELKKLTDAEVVLKLKALQFDVILNTDNNHRATRLAKTTGIKLRVGFISRWRHWFTCNRFAYFRRQTGYGHEAQRSATLLSALNLPNQYTHAELIRHLNFNIPDIDPKVSKLIDSKRINLILHPSSNGNGREWPLSHYQALIETLPKERFKIFITGTQNERETLAPLLSLPDIYPLLGKLNLQKFIQFISQCQGLIAAGTGPLHLAAALGINTLGLFPPRKSISHIRWGPLGKKTDYFEQPTLCKQVCDNSQCACMAAITVAQVKAWCINLAK